MRIRIHLFTLMRNRIRLLTLIWIRIRFLLLITEVRICEHWYTDPPRLHFEPPRFHCKRTRLHFEYIQLQNLDINTDTNPAFHSNADPDPTCQIMRIYADPQPFSNLIWTNRTKLRQDIPLSTAACAMSVPSWRKRKVLCTPSVFTGRNRTGLFFNGQESKKAGLNKGKSFKCLARQTMIMYHARIKKIKIEEDSTVPN